MATSPKFLWFNGAVVPWEEAKVHVSTATVLRGANVFEGVRAYWNADERELYIFRNDEHMARLWNSSKIMRMTVPWTKEELTRAQIEVIRANAFEGTVWFRLTLYVGEGDEVWPPEQAPIGGFILPRLSPHSPGITEGIDSNISSWTRIGDTTVPPRVKAGANYHNSRFAVMEARTNGYVEGIALDTSGYISEGSGENIFVVRDGKIFTPPLGSSVLPGITRDSLITLARELGYAVAEQTLPRELLYIADEVFFTGTAAEITPVRSVDRIVVGQGQPGLITRKLQEKFLAIVEGRAEDRHGWLTYCTQPVGALR